MELKKSGKIELPVLHPKVAQIYQMKLLQVEMNLA